MPGYADLMSEIRNLWKEVRRNATDIGRVANRVMGNGDDTGTVLNRLKEAEKKLESLMDLKNEIDLLSKRKNSIFLRVKDIVIIAGIIVTIVLSLKSMGAL